MRLARAVFLIGVAACAAPGPVVVSATEGPPVGQSERIQGRDGGPSALLWGRSVWTFGDTVLDVTDDDGQNWHHNSFGWTSDVDGSDGVDTLEEVLDAAGAPLHLLAPTAEEQAYNLAHAGADCVEPCGARWATWPGEPVWVEALGVAVVSYGLIHAAPGDFNFEGRGSGLATWSVLEDGAVRPMIDATAEHPDLIWGEDEIGWGGAPSVVDGQLYSFVCPQRGLARPCLLARAAVDRLLERDAWEVRTRSGWSDQVDDAVAVFDGAPILSVHPNPFLGGWLAVYSRPFSDDIVARTAPEPWGPWSAEAVLFRDPSTPYDAVHHLEFDEDGGRVIYLSFSRPTEETWFSSTFAWVRVELGAR